jgi:pimeloyl-ACP methyl ester carboxylesterase
MPSVHATGLEFDTFAAGRQRSPLVLLLHGFPQTHYSFRHQLPALAGAGFHAVAPNQRGYCPRARPADVESYRMELLVADALGIADGLNAKRFHLVGHDWGGQLAWLIGARHPERLISLSVLSRPHPAAFAAALGADREQAGRSRHHGAFDDPATAERWPDLAERVIDERGEISRQVHVLVDGRNVRWLPDGSATVLATDATIDVFPPAAGG